MTTMTRTRPQPDSDAVTITQVDVSDISETPENWRIYRQADTRGAGGKHISTAQLDRTTFRTSRLLEFCSRKELIAQTGHQPQDWPLVAVKELVDNAMDACEEAGIAPSVSVRIGNEGITVADNGPGIPAGTIESVLDFSVRASSREAYVSPTRGAQGNALKTLVAMPFALDGTVGRVTIESHGVAHHIGMRVDAIRQKPVIEHGNNPSSVKSGTRCTIHWPDCASTTPAGSHASFYQLAEAYSFLNPHATLVLDLCGQISEFNSTSPAWKKWRPSDPTCVHWYQPEDFRRLVAAYVSHDADSARDRSVRDLVGEFHGLSGTAKRRQVLEDCGLSRANLSDLVVKGDLDEPRLIKLLDAMKEHSRPPKPAALGIIGRDHLLASMKRIGCDVATFDYRRVVDETDGLPFVLETAFAAFQCATDPTLPRRERRLITGVNFSPGIANPFRDLGKGWSLDGLLSRQESGPHEPVAIFVHMTTPRVEYLDRGKSAIVLDRDLEAGEGDDE